MDMAEHSRDLSTASLLWTSYPIAHESKDKNSYSYHALICESKEAIRLGLINTQSVVT